MIGCEEEGTEIRGRIHDERRGTEFGSPNADAGDTSDFVGPGSARWTGHVNFAGVAFGK